MCVCVCMCVCVFVCVFGGGGETEREKEEERKCVHTARRAQLHGHGMVDVTDRMALLPMDWNDTDGRLT